jgi:hypothetical protein
MIHPHFCSGFDRPALLGETCLSHLAGSVGENQDWPNVPLSSVSENVTLTRQ